MYKIGVDIGGMSAKIGLCDREKIIAGTRVTTGADIEFSYLAEKIAEAMKINTHHVSMDAPFADGEDNSLLDFLPNTDSPSTDNVLDQESLRTEIGRVLDVLNDREQKVIKAFFGIGMQEMTLEEIGDKYNLTRERVRQIKEKAIRRLRYNTKSKTLKTYLGQ